MGRELGQCQSNPPIVGVITDKGGGKALKGAYWFLKINLRPFLRCFKTDFVEFKTSMHDE